jgi:hypothetical protein
MTVSEKLITYYCDACKKYLINISENKLENLVTVRYLYGNFEEILFYIVIIF